MVWSPLTTHVQENTVDRSSRGGRRIDSIGHHHAAGTSKGGTLALFAPGGRLVTPNYFVAGNEIWGIVPEEYRAYTSGSVEDDGRSITYEILNETGGPEWRISDETLATVARLDADIADRYGIPLRHGIPGMWEHRNLYEWFGRSYATACAGPGFSINNTIADTERVLAGGANDLGDDMIRIQATNRGIALVGPGYFRHLKNEEEVRESEAIISKHLTGSDRQFDVWRSLAFEGNTAPALLDNSISDAVDVLTKRGPVQVTPELAAQIGAAVKVPNVDELVKQVAALDAQSDTYHAELRRLLDRPLTVTVAPK